MPAPAHRTTMALEHHAGFVPYEWVEALGWETGKAPTGEEAFSAADRKDWYYHWKSEELLSANPQGMVPTLLDTASGKAVTESVVCVQFVDEVSCLHVCARMHTCAHTYWSSHTHTHTHSLSHIRTHTHTHTSMQNTRRGLTEQ